MAEPERPGMFIWVCFTLSFLVTAKTNWSAGKVVSHPNVTDCEAFSNGF